MIYYGIVRLHNRVQCEQSVFWPRNNKHVNFPDHVMSHSRWKHYKYVFMHSKQIKLIILFVTWKIKPK